MCLLCRLPVAQNHNFGQILKFGGLLYRPLFTHEGLICCAIADRQRTFTCQNMFRSVYSIALLRRKPPNFCRFWTSVFNDVDSLRQSENVEHGCTTTNLPLSNGMKSFLYSNVFMVKSGAKYLAFKSVTDKQKLNVYRRPGSE